MKKHNTILGIAVFLFLFLSAGFVSCTGTKDKNGNFLNKEFNKEKMITIRGEEISLIDNESIFTDESLGFGFSLTPSMIDRAKKGFFDLIPNGGLISLYYNAEVLDSIIKNFDFENVSQEEYSNFIDSIQAYIFNYAAVYRFPMDEKRVDEAKFHEYIAENYAFNDEVARLNVDDVEYVYYCAYNTDYSKVTLSDSEKDELMGFTNAIDELKNGIFVFPPQDQEGKADNTAQAPSDFSQFETVDLDGNTVTSAIFREYEVTMINIWATWCGPCVSEIPELAKLQGMLPSKTQLISICTDADSATEDAREILSSSGATYLTLKPSTSLQNGALKSVTAIPTTFFVDKDGKILGNPIIGVPGKEAATAYLEKINELLN